MLRGVMRVLLMLFVVMSSLPVRADPEAPLPNPIRERVLLMWGGGRTREEAEAFVESYQARSVDWARVVEAGAGYPRIIDGAELPGLRAGYFFVALGVCDVAEGAALEKVFKALEPRTYSRRVLWDEHMPLACPSLLPGWSFGKSAQVRVQGGTLTAATFLYEDVEGHQPRSWLMILGLLKKEDVESTVIEPPEEGVVSEVKGLKAGRGEVVLEESLTDPTCDTQPRAEVYTRTWRFSVEKGEVVTKQVKKLQQRKDCAQPSAGALTGG